ncbi:MAG: hypothetical protein ACRDP1_15445 [Nocardioidaceae bacterium]
MMNLYLVEKLAEQRQAELAREIPEYRRTSRVVRPSRWAAVRRAVGQHRPVPAPVVRTNPMGCSV